MKSQCAKRFAAIIALSSFIGCDEQVPDTAQQSSAENSVIAAQIQEALFFAESGKAAITEAYMSQGKWPADNPSAGMALPDQLTGNYVTGVAVEEGAIHIDLGNKANPDISGKTLTIRPAFITANPLGPVSWLCGYQQPADGMEAQGENRTSVPEPLLPPQCRS